MYEIICYRLNKISIICIIVIENKGQANRTCRSSAENEILQIRMLNLGTLDASLSQKFFFQIHYFDFFQTITISIILVSKIYIFVSEFAVILRNHSFF